MHLLVHALAERDWEEAALTVKQEPDAVWDAERFAEAMAPFFAEHGALVYAAEARRHRWTAVRKTGDRTWKVTQTLLDPEGETLWAIAGVIDLRRPGAVDGPLVRVETIAP
jgi:hypothetical protein